MGTALADPRTEAVAQAADDVDCLYCAECYGPDSLTICGEAMPDDGTWCPMDCIHPSCPMCEEMWEQHVCTDIWAYVDEI